MRYSDIKVGNIYFVNLEPVKKYEFGGNHLGIVLKKGKDKRTVTIVSLTSKSSGVGETKLNIGLVSSLPKRLIGSGKGNPLTSYVVLDQVRTLISNRVQNILDGKDTGGKDKVIDCPIDPPIFSKVMCELADFTINNLTDDDEIWSYHKNSLLNYSVKKLIDLTYTVIKNIEQENISEIKEIKYLYNSVLALKNDFLIDDYLNKNDVKNKVSETLLGIVSELGIVSDTRKVTV